MAAATDRCSRLHAQHLRSIAGETKARTRAIFFIKRRMTSTSLSMCRTRHFLFRALQSLAWQSVALRGRWTRLHRAGNKHRRSETSERTNSFSCRRKAFPSPLTWTWSITKGADLMWVPIPFENSFRMAYSRTHYGTGYYIYHQFVEGIPLSQPIRSWEHKRHSASDDVCQLIARARRTDLFPRNRCNSSKNKIQRRDWHRHFAAGEPVNALF